MFRFKFANGLEQLGDRVVPSAVFSDVLTAETQQSALLRELDPPQPSVVETEKLGLPSEEVDIPFVKSRETDPPSPDLSGNWGVSIETDLAQKMWHPTD